MIFSSLAIIGIYFFMHDKIAISKNKRKAHGIGKLLKNADGLLLNLEG